jgi:mxaJ protein
MCSRYRAKILSFLFAVSAVPTSTFRICAEPENLPMSDEQTNSGFEIEVAQILAKAMEKQLEVKWIPQRDQTYFRSTIGAGQCDAIMGVPFGFERVETTRPWYRTSFAFVTSPKIGTPPSSFDDPRLKNISIGIPVTGEGDIPPAIALTKRNLTSGFHPYTFFDNKEIVDAVAASKLDMGILWGPFAGYYASQSKNPVHVALTPERDGRMSMTFDTCIGVKKGNHQLKEQLDRAIETHKAEIAAVLAKWHVPLRR